MHFTHLAASVVGLASAAAALQLPRDHYLWGERGEAGATLQRRIAKPQPTPVASPVADAACTNGPLTRICWSNGFSIATDFDAKWPTTGAVHSFNLELKHGTCNQDGAGPRDCMLFNGQYPGPTIQANWGDILKITVKNSLTDNGTSVHWHGLRQLGTNSQDGTNGITECPLAPGQSKTYTFQATQFGTSWYHSHHSAQYGDGAFGGIIINGPASSNYDVDLGTYTINDWFHTSFWTVAEVAAENLQRLQNPPTPDNILLNGTNKNAQGGGSYGKVSLTKGKKYRLRLINTSVDNAIRVSLDNHPFTVISADFVPIHAYTTNWILINIGQRYDVVITANQDIGNYWFRAVAAADCQNSNGNIGLSIFSYVGANSSDPTSTAAPAPSVCQDEQGLVPYVQNTVPRDLFAAQVGDLEVDVGISQVMTNGQNIVFWGINMTAMDVQWDKPTLQYVIDKNTSYPAVENLIEIPNEGTWSFWIIQETHGTLAPFPHPIHLHGHDFYVLGSGDGVYDKVSSINNLTFNNPIRRDVANLPGGGWLAIAFPTDNPGAWLMHCHITWHISGGFGVQFLESKNLINLPGPDFQNTCNKWKSYEANPAWPKLDSGL